MRYLTTRRVLVWTVVPLIVAQVGCAARGVPVAPGPLSAGVSDVDRAACEELVRAEARAAKAAERAAAQATNTELDPSWLLLPLYLPFLPFGLLGYLMQAPFDLAEHARARARAHETEVIACLEPVIRATTLGADHPDVARSLSDLASRYAAVGNHARAGVLYVQALAIREKALGPDHEDVAATLEAYATLLHKEHRDVEATDLETRAQAIRAKAELSHAPETADAPSTEVPGDE